MDKEKKNKKDAEHQSDPPQGLILDDEWGDGLQPGKVRNKAGNDDLETIDDALFML